MIYLNKIYPYLLLILLSLTPLLWFRESMIIAGGDDALYLNPSVLVTKFFYSWIDIVNFGQQNISICYKMPFGFFWYILQKLSISNVLIQKLWFIFIWLVGSSSIYKLASNITNTYRYHSYAGLLAALLYQFNTFTMIEVLNVPKHLTYMSLPLLLYLFMKGIESKKNIYVILFALSTLLLTSAWVNPPAAIVVFIPIFAYLFYYVLLEDRNRKRVFFFLFKIFIITFLANVWWIIPYICSLAGTIEITRERSGSFSPSGSEVLEILRFMGLWAFRASHYLMPYFPYHNIYYNTPMVFLTYLIPIIALLPMLHLKVLNKKILFFYFLFIIGIFLTAGKYSPFGFIFCFLFKNLPGFWVFREPYAKFTPLNTSCVSILFGFAAVLLLHFIDKKVSGLIKSMICKIVSGTVLTSIILITSFPLLTGDSIWKYWNGSMRSYYVDVPSYWFELGEWLKENDASSRILTTPKATYGQPYDWDSGISTDGLGIPFYFVPNPYLFYNHMDNNTSQLFVNFVYNNFLNSESTFTNIVPTLGIKYVLQQNDFGWKYAFKDSLPPPIMKEILTSQDSINHVESFGKLDLYEIAEERYLPPIYGSAY